MAASDALVWPDREADGGDAPVAKKKDSRVLSGRGGGESSLSSLSGAHKITVTDRSYTLVHIAQRFAIGKGARRTTCSPAADRNWPESKPRRANRRLQTPQNGITVRGRDSMVRVRIHLTWNVCVSGNIAYIAWCRFLCIRYFVYCKSCVLIFQYTWFILLSFALCGWVSTAVSHKVKTVSKGFWLRTVVNVLRFYCVTSRDWRRLSSSDQSSYRALFFHII